MTDHSASFPSGDLNTPLHREMIDRRKLQKYFKKTPYFFLILFIIVIIVIVVIAVKNTSRQSASAVSGAAAPVNQVVVAKPLAVDTLNKSFEFPLRDANGNKVSQFKYEIQSAELDNQIIVKGQLATAVQGRVFLVLNLKITNNYTKSVQLNTRDYVRLIVNNSKDRLAADIHNDPVDVEAISTKYTRIGFPIDSNFKNLKLEVGEITGPKQTIQLNFK